MEKFEKNNSAQKPKKITVALQGGGVYGAFTWGVLDRLLDDDRIEIVGITGASAGAINAVALAHGLDTGGRTGAKQALKDIWRNLDFTDLFDDLPGGERLKKLSLHMDKTLVTRFLKRSAPRLKHTAVASFNMVVPRSTANKLRNSRLQNKLRKTIDFKKFRDNTSGIPVFINATDVHAQSQLIFDRLHISADAVAASCAIPGLLPPVMINGKPYLDGCISENPPIEPLKTIDTQDILIIQTVPIAEKGKRHVSEKNLGKKLSEHFLNASTLKNVEQIQKENDIVQNFPDEAKTIGLKTYHTHLIHDHGRLPLKFLGALDFNTPFITELYHEGYKAAEEWLNAHFNDLGQKSTYTANFSKKSSKKHAPPPQNI